LHKKTLNYKLYVQLPIFEPTKEDNGNWRIKTNIELDELIKHRNIINYVKA